jgi:hypothetical protein
LLKQETLEISLGEIIHGIQKEAQERRVSINRLPGQASGTGEQKQFPKPEYRLGQIGGRATKLLRFMGKLGLRIPVVSHFVRMSVESYVLPTKMNFLLQEIATLSERLDKAEQEIKERELRILDLEKKFATLRSETPEEDTSS